MFDSDVHRETVLYPDKLPEKTTNHEAGHLYKLDISSAAAKGLILLVRVMQLIMPFPPHQRTGDGRERVEDRVRETERRFCTVLAFRDRC